MAAAAQVPAKAVFGAEGAVMLRVHAVPRASKSQLAGFHGDAVRVRLQAPPVDGRANDALKLWAARFFGLAGRDVELVSGASSREKTLRLAGISAEAVLGALGAVNG